MDPKPIHKLSSISAETDADGQNLDDPIFDTQNKLRDLNELQTELKNYENNSWSLFDSQTLIEENPKEGMKKESILFKYL